MDPFLYFNFPRLLRQQTSVERLPHCPEGEIEGLRSNHPYIQISLAEASKPNTRVDHTPLAAPRRTTVSSSGGGVVRIRNKGGPIGTGRGGTGPTCQPQQVDRRISRNRQHSEKGPSLSEGGLLSWELEGWYLLIVKPTDGLQPGQDENDHRVRTILEPSVPAGARPGGLDRTSAPACVVAFTLA